MKIEATQDFLHGKMRFEGGLCYTVPDSLGAYFMKHGWAKEATADAKAFTVGEQHLGADAVDAPRNYRVGDTLDIQDAKVNLGAE
jgi:hypothetical protein